MSDVTKISVAAIEKIESGNFEFLPAVYIRAFIKSIATEVGLDHEIMLQKYQQANDLQPMSVDRTHPEQNKSIVTRQVDYSVNNKTLGYVAAAGLIFIIFVFILFNLPSNQKRSVPPISNVLQPQISKPDTLCETLPVTQSDILRLKVKALDTTWIRIVFNDSLADEVTFQEGDIREWISRSKFYMRIGNAGGIELELNGRNLGKPGPLNQITNIVVDESGTSRIPYSSLPDYMFVNSTP